MTSNLQHHIDVAYALAERASARSAGAYLRHVVIDSRPEPRRFGDIAEPWQTDLLGHLTPALESVSGIRRVYDGPRNFWFTLARGHDKTSSIGRLANWLLAFSRRSLNMATAAADSDQAGLIVEAMAAESRLNPWLSSRLSMGRTRVKGPGGVLKVLSADAGSSFGLNCDAVIIDELTHWKKRDLFDVLWSGRAKRPGSVFIVISNAGTIGSWQHRIYQRYHQDHDWFFYDAPPRRHLASWMTPTVVESIRKGLPRGLAKRVLDNLWIDPAEESDFLTRAEIEVCQEIGVERGLIRQPKGRIGGVYVAGIDYGPRRDRTALAVVHQEKDQQVVVDRLDVLQGSPEAPVAIQAVEDWITEVNKVFNHPLVVIDPYQMESTVQRFQNHCRIERFESRGGKANYEMAEALRSLIVNKLICWYQGAGLLVVDGQQESFSDELAGLILKPTPYGYRFDHEAQFHDDRAVAVGMAALYVLKEPMGAWRDAPPPMVEQRGEVKKEVAAFLKDRGDAANRRGLYGMDTQTR